MGLVKKASTLFEAVCRYRNNGRSSRHSKQSEVKLGAARKEERPSVPESKHNRSRLELRNAGAVASAMLQTAIFSHENHDQPSHGAYHPSAMEVPQPIQLVDDDEDDVVGADSYDEYEDEDEDDIDDSVVEDMRKLEESFKGISQKYRLINRIGEGTIHKLLRASISGTDHAQERSLQCTRPSNCFQRRTITTTRTI